ncbi:MAG TPA: LamG-like jellyroll fold domain-containing protein [Capsulimonadaceae bacterium]|jgi:gamma-glutamyltranspeptidase/glutathione hydrolase
MSKLLSLLAATACVACAFASASADDHATNAPLDKRLVWAHSMICYPLDLDLKRRASSVKSYGEQYPLDQQFGLEARTGLPWQYTDIQRAKDAGIDGFAIDLFDTPEAAVPYLNAADKAGGFLIAMCVDLSVTPKDRKEAEAYRVVSRYCDIAKDHPSAARIDGAFVIETYGTEQLSPEAWTRVRTRLSDAGYRTYWVVSIDSGFMLRFMPSYPADKISPNFGPFEAGYVFEHTGPWWPKLLEQFAALKRPFMGGAKPGYHRYIGLEVDPEGTALYRREWERDIASPLTWNTIVTWNDLGETTAVMPTGDYNFTRSDLTRWCSSIYKGQPLPFAEPRLYVTTVKTTYPGKTCSAEALVLNPLPRPVRVSIRLTDSRGKGVGDEVRVDVAPTSSGAATATCRIPDQLIGSYLRARAEMTDGKKRLAQVESAPILVLHPDAQTGYGSVAYSVPAAQALPGKVSLTATRDASGRVMSVTPVVPPGVTPHFVEVLHNTELARNVIDGPATPVDAPPHAPNGQLIGKTEWGFYIARVTDSDLRVGYSDPVYVAPPKADYTVRESYKFDIGSGATVADQSPFKNVAVLKDTTWSSPGPGTAPSCVSFNGKTSRINLVPMVTPDGPVHIAVTVRPRAYDSVIFGDTGGLIVALTPDGRVSFTRLAGFGQPWPMAVSASPIPLGEWTSIDCRWDGATSSISINGKLAGSVPCGPGFFSYVRAIGCNAHGLSSAYFTGDIASFEVRSLPADSRIH